MARGDECTIAGPHPARSGRAGRAGTDVQTSAFTGPGTPGGPKLRRAEEIGREGIATCAAQRLPWPCGTYGSVEVPGLLLGLAGIGYFYLRLADPESTPSVLITLPYARPNADA